MPQVRHYTVDIHVQAKVGTLVGDGGELTHGAAADLALAKLRQAGVTIGNVTVTETTIGGTPLLTGTHPRQDGATYPLHD